MTIKRSPPAVSVPVKEGQRELANPGSKICKQPPTLVGSIEPVYDAVDRCRVGCRQTGEDDPATCSGAKSAFELPDEVATLDHGARQSGPFTSMIEIPFDFNGGIKSAVNGVPFHHHLARNSSRAATLNSLSGSVTAPLLINS